MYSLVSISFSGLYAVLNLCLEHTTHSHAGTLACETYPRCGAPVCEIAVIHGDFVFFADRSVQQLANYASQASGS